MVGVWEGAWWYRGVLLSPRTTQGGYWGIPWPQKQTRETVPVGMYLAYPSDLSHFFRVYLFRVYFYRFYLFSPWLTSL